MINTRKGIKKLINQNPINLSDFSINADRIVLSIEEELKKELEDEFEKVKGILQPALDAIKLVKTLHPHNLGLKNQIINLNKLAKKNKMLQFFDLPTFSGTDKTILIGEFIEKFETVAEAENWDADTRAKYLKFKLSGKARDIISELSDNDAKNYSTIVSRLKNRLTEFCNFTDGLNEIQKTKQFPDESFPDFLARFNKIAKRVVRGKPTWATTWAEMRAEILLNNVNKDCRQYLIFKDVTTFDELVKEAERYDRSIGRYNEPLSNSHQMVEVKNELDKINSKISELSISKEVAGVAFAQNFARSRGRGLSRTNYRNTSPSRSNVRQQRGRSSPPANSGACYSCGRFGHFASQCRSRNPKRDFSRPPQRFHKVDFFETPAYERQHRFDGMRRPTQQNMFMYPQPRQNWRNQTGSNPVVTFPDEPEQMSYSNQLAITCPNFLPPPQANWPAITYPMWQPNQQSCAPQPQVNYNSAHVQHSNVQAHPNCCNQGKSLN